MATSAYINGYKPLDVSDFSGGLNLRDKSDAVGDKEAIDLLNVTFTDRGAVRQRDGYTDLSAADLTARVDSMTAHYTTAGARQLVLGCGTRIDVINQAGASLGAFTGAIRGPWTFAQFGDPARELVFCANGADPLVMWDGAAFSGGSGLATVNAVVSQAMPKASAVCLTGQQAGNTSGTNASNRLIATGYGTLTTGGPGGTQSTPSRVHFSNAGDPFRWETDGDIPTGRGRNYIDLTPGDGEYIIAAVTWRELVFIFKQTKFFVMWGEGIGANSTPTFQVREVVNNVGLVAPQAVAVGRDGVYFMNRRGVYRTNGGDPVLLSDVIGPMWTQDVEAYFKSRPINLAQLDLVRMLWHQEKLYVAVPTGLSVVNDRVLVYDTAYNWWSLYDVPAAALASFRSSATPEVHFGYASPLPNRVGHSVLGLNRDRGARMVSRWRSGWRDYGSPQVKTIREMRAWGRGATVISFARDYQINQAASQDVLFGGVGSSWTYAQLTGRGGSYAALSTDYITYADLTVNRVQQPLVDNALVRKAVRAVVFSTTFSDSPQADTWMIARKVRHLREIREASVGLV